METALRLLVIFLAARPALAAPAGAEVKRRELIRVQKEITAAKQEIEGYRKLEQSLGRDLHALESDRASADGKIGELRRSILGAERKKSELKTRLGALKMASGSWREAVAAEIRRYAADLRSREEAFGVSGLWKESFARAAILEKTRWLAHLRGLGRKTEIAVAETGRRAQELQSKSEKALAEQQSRRLKYERTQQAYAEAREGEAAAARKARELEESAQALNRLIHQLGRAAQRKAPPGVWTLAKHSLPWPAEGKVSESFGRERNERLSTWVIRQGIRLMTRPQAAVAAVGAGKVIFAGPFRSYGQVVILDHGEGFFSIYGDLGSILKAKGDKVSARETIALAGGAKGGGGALYLEIRRGSEALDPLIWLEQK